MRNRRFQKQKSQSSAAMKNPEVSLTPVEEPSDNKFKLMSQVFYEELVRMDGEEHELLGEGNMIDPDFQGSVIEEKITNSGLVIVEPEQLEDGEIDPCAKFTDMGKDLDDCSTILEHDEIDKLEFLRTKSAKNKDPNSVTEKLTLVKHLKCKEYYKEIEVLAGLQSLVTSLAKGNIVKNNEAMIEDGKFFIPSKSGNPKKKLNKDMNAFDPIKGSLRGKKLGILGDSVRPTTSFTS
ncbi:hypothetical protein MA16_Dca026440 [Dendrobium catenatum]|uniref:Uncharacterized protein n=1 Tax=Dendrobium catenatum TaxID=906689 RepID=A0A2I0WP50_9ASPA|nr:hypothetical protein MA16_Dca026440 [Dendrobium catenatum]